MMGKIHSDRGSATSRVALQSWPSQTPESLPPAGYPAPQDRAYNPITTTATTATNAAPPSPSRSRRTHRDSSPSSSSGHSSAHNYLPQSFSGSEQQALRTGSRAEAGAPAPIQFHFRRAGGSAHAQRPEWRVPGAVCRTQVSSDHRDCLFFCQPGRPPVWRQPCQEQCLA